MILIIFRNSFIKIHRKVKRIKFKVMNQENKEPLSLLHECARIHSKTSLDLGAESSPILDAWSILSQKIELLFQRINDKISPIFQDSSQKKFGVAPLYFTEKMSSDQTIASPKDNRTFQSAIPMEDEQQLDEGHWSFSKRRIESRTEMDEITFNHIGANDLEDDSSLSQFVPVISEEELKELKGIKDEVIKEIKDFKKGIMFDFLGLILYQQEIIKELIGSQELEEKDGAGIKEIEARIKRLKRNNLGSGCQRGNSPLRSMASREPHRQRSQEGTSFGRLWFSEGTHKKREVQKEAEPFSGGNRKN